MTYSFNPMTDEELDTYNLLPDGIYAFEVAKSTRKVSKAGNQMAALQLYVWDKEGKMHIVFDNLIFSTVPLNIKKVKRFCDTTKLSKEYKEGRIPEDLTKRNGFVEIGTEDAKPKEGGGFYPKKNIVIEYVMTAKGALMHDMNYAEPEGGKDDFKDDEEIPF